MLLGEAQGNIAQPLGIGRALVVLLNRLGVGIGSRAISPGGNRNLVVTKWLNRYQLPCPVCGRRAFCSGMYQWVYAWFVCTKVYLWIIY